MRGFNLYLLQGLPVLQREEKMGVVFQFMQRKTDVPEGNDLSETDNHAEEYQEYRFSV